jgi:hypothetical protein
VRNEAGQLAMTYSYSTSIEHELDGNERLLWKGRPRSGIRLRSSDAYLIPFSLVWAGFAIVWEFAAIMKIPKTNPATWIFPLAGVPFVLFGLYIVFGRFFLDTKLRDKTEYALTSRRAIIVSGLFSRKVRSIELRSTSETTITERSDGSGTITFGAVCRSMDGGCSAICGFRECPRLRHSK